jgi:hypothetical protein
MSCGLPGAAKIPLILRGGEGASFISGLKHLIPNNHLPDIIFLHISILKISLFLNNT